MQQVKSKSGQIPALQSLRGIAAFAVAAGHTLTYYYTTSSYGSMVLNGRGAVVVFFVLSGFVLTWSLRDNPFSRGSILRFWGQRAFRIYPALWSATIVGLWYLVVLHWQISLVDGSFGPPGTFRVDRFNPWFVGGSFTGMVAYVLPQLWSIHVEILGSLAIPAIAFTALHRPRPALWRLMGSAVAVSYIMGTHTPYHSALFLQDFVLGAALAAGALNPLLQSLPAPQLLIVAGLGSLGVTRFLPIEDYFSPTAHLIESVLAGLVVGLVAEREAPRWMTARPLLIIGQISYSIYLLFFVVMCSIAKLFALFELHYHVKLHVIALSLMLAAGTSAALVPLAWLLFTYVELPGIWLGKILLAKRRGWHDSQGGLLGRPDGKIPPFSGKQLNG